MNIHPVLISVDILMSIMIRWKKWFRIGEESAYSLLLIIPIGSLVLVLLLGLMGLISN